VAITGVVVIPERGKIKGTWMGYDVLGDAVSDGASGGVISLGVVDTVYM